MYTVHSLTVEDDVIVQHERVRRILEREEILVRLNRG